MCIYKYVFLCMYTHAHAYMYVRICLFIASMLRMVSISIQVFTSEKAIELSASFPEMCIYFCHSTG